MALRGSALARQLRLRGCRVAANYPVATRPLGDVERLVGGLHQGFPAVAVPWEDGDAQAQREIGNRFAIEHDRLAGHRSPDPFRDRHRRPAVRTPQYEHELIAAIAGDEVLGPDRGQQDLSREVAQYLVTGGMTDAVIDRLEVVHVAHDDGKGFLRLPRPLQLAVEVGLELTVVRDPGHGIGRRQLFGALVGCRILHRDHRLVLQRLQYPDFAQL